MISIVTDMGCLISEWISIVTGRPQRLPSLLSVPTSQRQRPTKTTQYSILDVFQSYNLSVLQSYNLAVMQSYNITILHLQDRQ